MMARRQWPCLTPPPCDAVTVQLATKTTEHQRHLLRSSHTSHSRSPAGAVKVTVRPILSRWSSRLPPPHHVTGSQPPSSSPSPPSPPSARNCASEDRPCAAEPSAQRRRRTHAPCVLRKSVVPGRCLALGHKQCRPARPWAARARSCANGSSGAVPLDREQESASWS
jgi:hypothetical protein